MEKQDSAAKDAIVIDLAQLIRAVFRRKGILAAALIVGLAGGAVWHFLAAKKFSAKITFVRNQAMDEASPLGGIASLSLLGMSAQSSDPPLLKFIDKYLTTREFISRLDSAQFNGVPLAKALDSKDSSSSADAFYGKMSGRIKVIKDAGLISIKVWDNDPALCVFLTNLVFERFQTDFNTAKNKIIQDNLSFMNDLVAKSHRELNVASDDLRNFLERNRGLGSPSLEQTRSELMMKVRMAEEKYLMAEKERGLLEIKKEKKDQSLVIIEKPFLPASPEYPKRSITVILPALASLILAFLLIGFLDRRTWLIMAAD